MVNLITTCCVVAWRIFWLTTINRSWPAAAPTSALTQLELQLLDQLVPERRLQTQPHALTDYIIKIAGFGGYLAHVRDPAPGHMVMWRGLARLTDIAIGYSFRVEKCGQLKARRDGCTLDVYSCGTVPT